MYKIVSFSKVSLPFIQKQLLKSEHRWLRDIQLMLRRKREKEGDRTWRERIKKTKIESGGQEWTSTLLSTFSQVRASLVNGDIQLMWNITGDERKCSAYRLFAYMGVTAPPMSTSWTEVTTTFRYRSRCRYSFRYIDRYVSLI